MNFFRLILLLCAASFGCTYMAMPTDFASVTAGTRANLKANFSEAENKFNPCADSVHEVRSRFSGYSSSFAITSLENLRLRLDGDGTASAKFILETTNGDSLFRVSEDSTAKFFGSLTVAGATTSTGALSATSATFSGKIVGSDTIRTSGSTEFGNNSFWSGAGQGVWFNSPGTFTYGMYKTGTNLAFRSGSTSTFLTVDLSGLPTFSSLLTLANGLSITGGSAADGALWKSAGAGLSARGVAGSSYDLSFFTPAATYLMRNPTGTQSLEFPGTGTNTFTGLISANNSVSVPDANGLITTISAANRALIYRNGTALNIGENGGWTGINYRLPTGATHTFQVNGTTIATIDGSNVTANVPTQVNSTLTASGAGSFSGGLARTSATSISGAASNQGNFIAGTAGGLQTQIDEDEIQAMSGAAPTSLYINNAGGAVQLSASGYNTVIRGSLTINQTATTTQRHVFTAAPRFSSVTASQILSVDANKDLTSIATTGSGSVTLATSPTITTPSISSPSISSATLTGTTSAASITASGTITADTLISSKFYEENTFTASLTGCTTTPTGTARYVRVGKMVTIFLPSLTGTSNASTLTITGLPASIQASRQISVAVSGMIDNSSVLTGCVLAQVYTSIQFSKTASDINFSSWTTSGTKGITVSGIALTYTLQ